MEASARRGRSLAIRAGREVVRWGRSSRWTVSYRKGVASSRKARDVVQRAARVGRSA
jgi:hypothetical protein